MANIIALTLNGSVLLLYGYPTGAPPDACSEMGAEHNTTHQFGTMPYVIGVSSETYCPGQNITGARVLLSLSRFQCAPICLTDIVLTDVDIYHQPLH